MSIVKTFEDRKSNYSIGKDVDITREEIEDLVKKIVECSPSAFNSQGSRVVLLFGENNDKFWDIVLSTLLKRVDPEKADSTREKINSFRAGYGTILIFEDQDTITVLQEKFPLYAETFPVWAMHSNGMLQFALWTALREKDLGASLQHYNPIIDDEVAEVFDIPKSWKLQAQMPFGNIIKEAEPKPKKSLEERVKIYK